MTLQEVIDNLTAMLGTYLPSEPQDEPDALKLGIEALRFRLTLKMEDPEFDIEPLPGETEE